MILPEHLVLYFLILDVYELSRSDSYHSATPRHNKALRGMNVMHSFDVNFRISPQDVSEAFVWLQ